MYKSLDKHTGYNDDKFFIDKNGSVILNRRNAEVQKAFAANVAVLSTKKDR